jgi:glycosyltransferase involved in cell wall biosynthesis
MMTVTASQDTAAMPRVLFVHHRPQSGGAVRSLALLIRALSSEWEAHVLVPGGLAAEEFAAAGATVHRGVVPAFTHTWDVQYRGLRWLVAAREAAWIPAHRRRIRHLIRDVAPDIVHVNDVVLVASAAFASHAGARVVWHLRSSLPHRGTDRRSRAILRSIDRYASAAIAIDRDVASTFPVRVPLAIVPNAVEVDQRPAIELAIPAGRVSVGLFGYLRRQKGWPQFLDALKLLRERDAPVQAVIVGGGVRTPAAFRGFHGRLLEVVGVPDEESDFDRQVAALGLTDRVTRLPFTSEPARAIKALDIVVFPNQGTGLGRPVLEAAAHGKPVVASGSQHGGGVLEPNVTGLLVERGDTRALADAIERLAHDDALRDRLGTAAADAAKAFAPTAVAQQVEAVWRAAMSRR